MSGADAREFRFGDFLLRPRERQLLCAGSAIPLPPKIFDVLLLLVENHGRLVEKDEFLDRVWGGAAVEEIALAHAVSHLRRILRQGGDEAVLIETVAKRGYRFVAKMQGGEVERPGPTLPVRVAVLPFENLSGDEQRDYLAEGLTEEVIAALGHVDPERPSVIGRTSVMSYRRTTKSLAEIGRELGAQFLVESSVRAESDRLRIISRLIRAHDQVQVWSAAWDSEPASVLDFQRELSAAIARDVRMRLSPELVGALASRQPRHTEAYDLYLRGRYFWNQLSAATSRRAIDFYTRATQLDGGYALAWAGLAIAWASGPISGDAAPLEVWPRSRDASARAVAMGPNLAEIQTSLGVLKFWLDWDWRGAETALRKAIELDCSYSLAHRMLGVLLSHMGQHQEAADAMTAARSLDPLDATHHALSAQVAFNAHSFAAAIRFAERALVLDPQFWVAHYQLAMALEQSGDGQAALDALRRAAPFSDGNSKVIALRGYVLGRLRKHGEAREVLNTLDAVSQTRYVPPYATALVHAGLADRDAAYEWLDRAFDAHDVHLVLAAADPKWDEFREDRRFDQLLRRCAFVTNGEKSRPQQASMK